MGAYGEKLNFLDQRVGKNIKKINVQILMGIALRCTKLHILYNSDTESHFFYHV